MSGQILFLKDECGLRSGGHLMAVGFRVFSGHAKVEINVVNRFRNLPVATVSDAMNRMSAGGTMLRPMHAGGVLAGAAVTVKTRPGDNLMMHKAFDIAEPGDVIVVDAGGDVTNALIGENAAAYAESLGLAGVVINGAIRDSVAIAARKFPIFAIGITHRGPYKDGPGEINVPISIDGMVIVPGDLMLGDGDGVVCVPRERVEEVYAAASAKHQRDGEDARAVTERKVEREWVDAKLRELGCEFLTHQG
jgi:regulator of RNase E activity RraA